MGVVHIYIYTPYIYTYYLTVQYKTLPIHCKVTEGKLPPGTTAFLILRTTNTTRITLLLIFRLFAQPLQGRSKKKMHAADLFFAREGGYSKPRENTDKKKLWSLFRSVITTLPFVFHSALWRWRYGASFSFFTGGRSI